MEYWHVIQGLDVDRLYPNWSGPPVFWAGVSSTSEWSILSAGGTCANGDGQEQGGCYSSMQLHSRPFRDPQISVHAPLLALDISETLVQWGIENKSEPEKMFPCHAWWISIRQTKQ